MGGARRLLLAGVAILALFVAAPAGATTVTRFKVESKVVYNLAQARDGTIFYTGTDPFRSSNPQPASGVVGRVGPDGPLGETAIPSSYAGDIAVGDEGDAWLAATSAGIARLTAGGNWESVLAGQPDHTDAIASAAGGGIWFTSDEPPVDTVGRISADGTVSRWPTPMPDSGPGGIVEDREGDAWFAEFGSGKIARVTPSGQITEYRIPKGTPPEELTVDAAGDVWFAARESHFIGRLSPDGTVAMFGLPGDVTPAELAAGDDGRIWFTEYEQPRDFPVLRHLGRIGANGRYSEVTLPRAVFDLVDLVAGAEGGIWFAADGQRPCEGGGGSCLLYEPRKPAIVGHVEVDPLTAALPEPRAMARPNRADVPISCSEGKAGEECRGTVELKVGGRTVGRDRYVVPVDYTRNWPAKRLRRVPSLLKLAGHGRRALAIIRPDTGRRVSRTVVLSRAR